MKIQQQQQQQQNPEDRKLIRFLYLLNVIGVHNNEDTEQSDGDEEVQVLQNSSHFGSHHLWEPLLHPYERLLWIHLSLSLSLRTENFPERVTENFKALDSLFFSTLYPIPSRHVSNDADYINKKKKGQLVFTFSLVLTKIIHSFLQYSTVLYESGKFLNNMFGWVEEGKKMRKKKRFLYVWDLERVKVERE